MVNLIKKIYGAKLKEHITAPSAGTDWEADSGETIPALQSLLTLEVVCSWFLTIINTSRLSVRKKLRLA